MRSVRHVMNISFCHHFFISLSFVRFVKPVLNIQPVLSGQAALLGKGQKIERNGIHVKQSVSRVVHWGRGKTAEPGNMPLMLPFPSPDYCSAHFARRFFSPFRPTVEPGPSLATPSQGRPLYYYCFIIIFMI